ncbi:MAG TPA: hypothetical protein VH280_01725 [Verrucomicrobiae bacterium]|nr:hypothetical protein [Verrucomicrobiae bacterium]
MSFKEIKNGVAELPDEQQDHLAVYLVHLRHQHDARLRNELSSRLDERIPAIGFQLTGCGIIGRTDVFDL